MGRSTLQPVAVAMVFVLVFWAGVYPLDGQNASGPADPQTTVELIKQLKDAEKIARAYKADIPAEAFELPRLFRAVGADTTKLFTWVRDNTFLVPYRGILRNAQGVLIDRLGNSLDRSLLLAELLRLARKEVRLCRGQLSQAQLSDLLAKIRKVPEAGSVPIDVLAPQAVKDQLAKYGEKSRTDIAPVLNRLETTLAGGQQSQHAVVERMKKQTGELRAILGPAASSPPASAANDGRSFEDHWWVQVKEGPAWLDLDPSLPQSLPGERLTEAREQFGIKDLPADLFHKVQCKVIIERVEKSGNRVEETVLDHDLLPYEVIDKPIAFYHYPPNQPQDKPGQPATENLAAYQVQAEKISLWLPVLAIGKAVCYDRAFDNAGRTVDYSYRAGGGGILGGAQDLFRKGLDEVGPKQAGESWLTAEWLEFTVVSPGRPTRTMRRQVFDVLGAEKRQSRDPGLVVLDKRSHLNRAFSLLGKTDLLVFPCQLTSRYIDWLFTTDFIESNRYLIGILENERQDLSSVIDPISRMSVHHGTLYQFALIRSLWRPHPADLFLSSPTILAYHSYLESEEKKGVIFNKAFDIVENFVDVVPWTKENPFFLRLEQGVADTNAEALLLDADCDCTPGFSTAELFERNAEGWQLITNVQDLKSKAAGASPEEMAWLAEELRNGNYLIAPKGKVLVSGGLAFGWWKIDPRTGQVLGMMEPGWGVKKTEYAITFYKLVATVTIFGALIWCNSEAKWKKQKEKCLIKFFCDVFLYMTVVAGGTTGVLFVIAVLVEGACRFT